jgi:DNA polymerase III sliding clamp (beta) subunit (PCNA family)
MSFCLKEFFMNIQLTVKELLKPLESIIGAAEKATTLPILSHVLIQLKNGELTLTTTLVMFFLLVTCYFL